MIRWLAVFLLACVPAWADISTKQGQVYPLGASGTLTLTLGGTAQNFANATGGSGQASPAACLIVNPATATEQGIATAEAIWWNVVGTAAAAAGGASVPLEAGNSVIVYPATNAISWIAATTGHKVSGYCWQ